MSDRPFTDTSDRTLDSDSTPESTADVRGGPTFEAPWQARAFSLAVVLTDEDDEDDLSWAEFQPRLVEEIDGASENGLKATPVDEQADMAGDGSVSETVYYQQWLAALERLLVERNVIDSGELRDRVESFESGERDAHEFVDGDPHEHVDSLPDGHGDGADHGHGAGHGHDAGQGHGHDHDHTY